MNARNWTWDAWKSSKCSYTLNHFSSPPPPINFDILGCRVFLKLWSSCLSPSCNNAVKPCTHQGDVLCNLDWLLTKFRAALLSLCGCLSCLGIRGFSSLSKTIVVRLNASCCIFPLPESCHPLHLCAERAHFFLLFSHGILQNIKCELVSCGKKLTLICSFWGYCEFIITGVLKIASLLWKLFSYQHGQYHASVAESRKEWDHIPWWVTILGSYCPHFLSQF